MPLNGCYLVVGGPGTGKTVVVLLRLRRHIMRSENRNHLFLVYNHLLHVHAKQLFGSGMNSSTWNSWFWKTYAEFMQKPVPKIESDSKYKPIDWEAVIDKIIEEDLPDQQERPYIFIDEGQDMPPQFYDSLIRLGFENFYIVADQNQAITSENSSRKQISDAFAIDPNEVIELTRNYRNTFPIARLAKAFYTGDPASPPVKQPPKSSAVQQPYLIEYGRGCRLAFDTMIERILKHADRDPRKLIGIIAPSNDIRKRYYNTLKEKAASDHIRFDNGAPRIVTYYFGEKCNLRFDEGGIAVINAQSCKGLEFDTVFIADVHAFYCSHSKQDETRRLFYVMVARAIEKVFLLREAGKRCRADSILPVDSDILTIWRG